MGKQDGKGMLVSKSWRINYFRRTLDIELYISNPTLDMGDVSRIFLFVFGKLLKAFGTPKSQSIKPMVQRL